MEANSRRFFAIVEVADETDPDSYWAIVDAVAEDALPWIASIAYQGGTDWGEPKVEWETLTLRCESQALRRRNIDPTNRSIWYDVVVSRNQSADGIGSDVVLLGDTEGDLPKLWITQIKRADEDIASDLTTWAMLAYAPRTVETLIAGALDIALRGVGETAVAAYDVGQGNCNAIVDKSEHPRIFYDLGWPPNFHAKTRPPSRPALFSCQKHCTAPVVLSHWDMDHWAFAVASSALHSTNISSHAKWNDAALRRFWIARPPLEAAHQLGPMHMKLFEALQGVELLPGVPSLLLWPDDTLRIQFKHGWIEACTPMDGGARDRNNSGLAMFVVNDANRVILLPGDADFASIPSLRRWRRPSLVGLVAPHHGSRVTPSSVPMARRRSPATLVFSVGVGNSYGHPKDDARETYAKRRWIEHRTLSRVPCAHRGTDLGNRLLRFSDAQAPRCGCGCAHEGKLCLTEAAYQELASSGADPLEVIPV